MTDPLHSLTGNHSGQFANNYSESENRQFTKAFDAITQGFVAAMNDGVAASSPLVQELVQKHYDFCLQFWKPNRESYKALAMSYILPSPYSEHYEAVAPGLGKYHYDAMVIFADNRLS